ncbi:MAG TPA: HU family DNA-binding protein [Trueperaceae bacterium]|nr:HU family DNA-binding protein [Trueperaceae bacterium]
MAKSKTVSKADLVGEVVSATKLPRKTVKETVDALLDTMMSEIASGNKVTLTGFGSFEVRSRKERSGVRPGTRERISIPASNYPAFKAGKSLKDRVSSRR